MDKPEKRIDLNSELGMTRRDLIRRGAIARGTLLWVAPAIQSMAPKAFAQEATGSVLCTACQTNIVDPDGTGGQPPVITHTTYNPTPTCCNCLKTHNINFCDNANLCDPVQEDLPGPCPPTV